MSFSFPTNLTSVVILAVVILFLVFIVSNQSKEIKSLKEKLNVFIQTEHERSKQTQTTAPMKVNHSGIRREEAKVSDMIQYDSILKDSTKVSYCRCWQSKKWPLCDGAHNAWNQANGDNVGPVSIVKPMTPAPVPAPVATATAEGKGGENTNKTAIPSASTGTAK